MEKNLSESERIAVSVFGSIKQRYYRYDDDEDINQNDFVDKIHNDEIVANQYEICDWIPSTSNLCERSFSRSKLVFSERAKNV